VYLLVHIIFNILQYTQIYFSIVYLSKFDILFYNGTKSIIKSIFNRIKRKNIFIIYYVFFVNLLFYYFLLFNLLFYYLIFSFYFVLVIYY